MLVDCEKDVERMLDESSSEHLQPMKEKMEQFINHVQKSLHDVSTKLSSTQEHFNKVPSTCVYANVDKMYSSVIFILYLYKFLRHLNFTNLHG